MESIDIKRAEPVTAQEIEKVKRLGDTEPQVPYSLGWKTLAAIIALALANCCATLANTTNTIIKFQVMTVGGQSLAPWIANSNFLITLAIGPILGSLSDRLGKKRFIVGGCISGVVGSVLSGSAHTVHRIIGGNILTGLANAGCIISVSANQEVMPNKFRPYSMGLSQTINSLAAILGTFLAAAFVKLDTGGAGGWRWSYYFNGIVYGLAGFSVSVTYFPPPPLLRRRALLREILTHIDYVGIIIFTGSLAALMIGLTWGGATYAWDSSQCIATLTVGCVGLVSFGLYEWLAIEDGIFDHRLMQTYTFPILLFVCAVDGMLLLGVNILYSQEIFDLFSTDSIRIAVILSPYLITSTVGCIPAGWIMAVTKSYRWLLVAALVSCSLFAGLMGLVNPNRLHMALAFSTVLGIGTAVTTVIPVVALGLTVPPYLLGTAATISISCRALGGIIGITIFTAIYSNKFVPNPTLSPAEISQTSSEAWKWVWVAIAAIVLANAIVSCFVGSVSEVMNEHVESALETCKTRDEQLLETA